MKVERESPPEIGITQLRAGTALIDILTADSKLCKLGGGPPTQTENNMDHFCLQLKTISEKEISEHLKSHGIDADEFSDCYGAQVSGRSIYIKDPEGNTIELRLQI